MDALNTLMVPKTIEQHRTDRLIGFTEGQAAAVDEPGTVLWDGAVGTVTGIWNFATSPIDTTTKALDNIKESGAYAGLLELQGRDYELGQLEGYIQGSIAVGAVASPIGEAFGSSLLRGALARANGGDVKVTAGATGEVVGVSINETSTSSPTARAILVDDSADNESLYDGFSDSDFYNRVDQSEVANRLNSSAGTIKATPGATTTILGRWNPDMQDIIETQTLLPKSSDFGPNPGGYSILNVDTNLQGDSFWNTYNKPFLDAALQRGDPIYLSTIPKVKADVIRNGSPTGMYGKELEYLIKNNVKPKNISGSDWVKIKGWFQ